MVKYENIQEVFMNRRKSREVAMTLLYESTINKEKYEDIFQNFSENTDTKNPATSLESSKYRTHSS